MSKYNKYGLNVKDAGHQEEISQVVKSLPVDTRVVIAYRFGLLGMECIESTSKIAKTLGMPEIVVKKEIENGSKMIRSIIESRPTTRAGRARKALGLDPVKEAAVRVKATLSDILC